MFFRVQLQDKSHLLDYRHDLRVRIQVQLQLIFGHCVSDLQHFVPQIFKGLEFFESLVDGGVDVLLSDSQEVVNLCFDLL